MKTLLAGLITLASASSALAACKIAGPDNAKVTIEEFADFHCGYCAKGSQAMKQVVKAYPTEVKIVYRNLPLPFHDPGATTAAKAFSAACIQDPQQAHQLQNSLFETQERLVKEGDSYLFEAAKTAGLDVEKLKTDMKGAKVAKDLQEDQKAAERLGIKGTPSFLIGKEVVVGARPFSDYQKVIEKQLGR